MYVMRQVRGVPGPCIILAGGSVGTHLDPTCYLDPVKASHRYTAVERERASAPVQSGFVRVKYSTGTVKYRERCVQTTV